MPDSLTSPKLGSPHATAAVARVCPDPFVTATPCEPSGSAQSLVQSRAQHHPSLHSTIAHSSPSHAAPPPPPQHSLLAADHHDYHPRPPAAPWRSIDRPVRAPDPAKRVPANDELHSAIDRQALAEQSRDDIRLKLQRKLLSASAIDLDAELAAARPIRRHHRSGDKASGDEDDAANDTDHHHHPDRRLRTPSPGPSTATMTSTNPLSQSDSRALPPHRTISIDSTASNVSSVSAAVQRSGGMQALRAPQDVPAPQDAAALIAAAGSAEVALRNLLEKTQQTASHNAQLWRLVEKQRAMLLDLNRNLETALKEKEKYKRRLKEHLAGSAAAPAVAGTASRTESQSPAAAETLHDVATKAPVSRNVNSSLRKASNHSDAISEATSHLERPASPTSSGSGSGRNTVQSGSVHYVPPSVPASTAAATLPVSNPSLPMTPTARWPHAHTASDAQTGQTTPSTFSATSPSSQTPNSPYTDPGFASPKTRKAPPAPLKLNLEREVNVTNNILDASESEYEDDPESSRTEHLERGRRKTREDDEREREAQAQAREVDEQRSRSSKKSKKSRSKTATATDADENHAPVPPPPTADVLEDAHSHASTAQPPVMEHPVDIVRQRAFANVLHRNGPGPGLLSPGLPMSPRPGDRPLNSPMPRSGKVPIPMSPRAGLPLSPRAPRQPLPLPPQTPVAGMAPHLDRAKLYHQQMAMQAPQATTSISERLGMADEPVPAPESSLAPSHYSPVDPGVDDIFRGLATDEYPDLLLPPNALANVSVTTASPRMKPSRASFIAPKPADENPVFTLAVHARSDNKQLWRVEKGYNALALLDQQVKSICTVRDRLPDRGLFSGHAPSRIDARRSALNRYLDGIMEALVEERAALVVCKFLSTDAIGVEGTEEIPVDMTAARADSPVSRLRPNRAGYLTKRGKNFGGWKARFFVLDGPNLKYFEGPGGAHLGSIKLQNAQIGRQSASNPNPSDDDENQYRHAFLILEPKKKDSTALVRHVLCAESDEERDEWVNALLQYVDWKDDEEPQLARQAQVSKSDFSSPRSPHLQKSTPDLRSGGSESLQAVGYSDTVAGEAPIMGAVPATPRVVNTPSPITDRPVAESTSYPVISGPSNPQLISNTENWGMRPPPTPNPKDRKRSVFTLPFGRGHSSSDSAPSEIPAAKASSPTIAPQDRVHAPIRAVFGIPLAEAVEVARPAGVDTYLPAVVYRCIEYLTAQNAVAEEGIFRLSGSNTVIKSLKERFNHEGDVNLLAEDEYYDVHAVASLLKLYLRELPSTLLTRELHLDFLSCIEISPQVKVPRLRALVERLPHPNRAMLESLSAFMLLIVQNVAVNKMNVRNLGVVFSPTLNLPGPLISAFIECQSEIFGSATTSTQSSESATSIPATSSSANSTAISSSVVSAAVAPGPPIDLRSPRKQMFSELPTPAYNQTTFFQQSQHSLNNPYLLSNTLNAFPAPSAEDYSTPLNASAPPPAGPPTVYPNSHHAPSNSGPPTRGFSNLNDALLRAPSDSSSSTSSSSAAAKARRRESAMHGTVGAGFQGLNHAAGTVNPMHPQPYAQQQPQPQPQYPAPGFGNHREMLRDRDHLPLRKSSLQKLNEEAGTADAGKF